LSEGIRILFATDGSREAVAAAHLLASLPLRSADQLTLLLVVPETDAPDHQASGPSKDALVTAREVLCDMRASIMAIIRRGSPTDGILRTAAEEGADLLVVGACGRSSVTRFLLGSVAERVARHAPCPVLIVRPSPSPLRKVVLGLDDSPCSARAADWLLQFPLRSDGEVRLVTVVPLLEVWSRSAIALGPPVADHVTTLAQYERETAQEQLDTQARPFGARGTRAVTEIRSGDPALGLLQVAEEEGADLIVVGSHGQGAVKRFLLGSVSEKVLRHAHCSVLVVRPPA
jgi:nucleotide-binding universal stress UspA family protein